MKARKDCLQDIPFKEWMKKKKICGYKMSKRPAIGLQMSVGKKSASNFEGVDSLVHKGYHIFRNIRDRELAHF